ncbi:MAG: universal stress protein [Diaphorobacter nitroreducens]|uniref:Nucleotide-binding universal stress UspA family protein n=2 Tax=Diaphorobacter TaxID=238749 RepID=A0AAX1WWS1_9BURK|nr:MULTISPECIES: universal stress protein [Diaphorobacter]MDU7585776.1 universal stress protein [Acidovorax sp.]TFI49465.1 universal stress protein [Diaphorobacter sp. DS2]UOB05630.1 universal stress protein [Diaphorobacter sp. LI3]ACM31580.1 UspA domain protein [[Acidovorax] ebreus TPSY]ASI69639.1 universal stress protein UspA [Diaphorobacter nitroreducens]
MNILLAVDGSTYTKKMLAYLAAHDEMLGSSHTYTAITVQPQLPPRARAALGKEVVDKYHAEEGEKVLSPVVKFMARQGVQLKTMTKVGPAGETIAKVAESGKYDLVVMGTHGHGSLGKLVMGSVSTQVLANCQVPVLLVR